MNSWSRTRKRIILAIVLAAVIVLIGVPFFFLFYEEPTCFDKKLNGDETGVDCGGSCQLLCSAESLPLIIKGDPRVLSIATSTFEVVALFENPNADAEIYRGEYLVKIFDSSSAIPIKILEGSTFIPKGETFAIFEGPFNLEAGVVPTRAVLEWQKEGLVWRKNTEVKPELLVKDAIVSRATSTPRLTAVVENLSLGSVSNIDLIALISDEEGNIFAASKTFVDTLAVGEESPVVFTWPRPFSSRVAGVLILTRIFPDPSFIR